MVRSALGILCGGIVWQAAFLILAQLLIWVWPAYAAAARSFVNTHTFEFTPAMAGLNILYWILAEICAGWVTVIVAKRREPVWILAALLLVYMSVMHFYVFWTSIPWWYNIIVVISVVPAVWLGAKLASRDAESTPKPGIEAPG